MNLLLSFLALALLVACSTAASSDAQLRGLDAFHRDMQQQQGDDANYCIFNQATCREIFLTECKSLANKVEDAWCTNINSGAHNCCGSYDDCCTHNKGKYTVVILTCILAVAAAVLSCCYFIASCPLRQFVEEKKAKAQG